MNLASLTRNWRHSQRAITLLSLFCVMSLPLRGQEAATTLSPEINYDAWRVWLEPKFMRPGAAQPVTGAKQTLLAFGQLTEDGLTAFHKEEFAALGIDPEPFLRLASLNAAADLAKLHFRFERNQRKIIRYVAVESEAPVVASAVMCPGFLDLWKNTLGEKILLVVPNRNTAYLFPRIASEYQEYAPMVLRAYHETAYPVGIEVFELSAEGWRCLGSYSEP